MSGRGSHSFSGATPDEIRSGLGRVLKSAAFSTSPRLRDFLTFIVEAVLSGQAPSIKAYTVGVEALGRGRGFNPDSDAIVRVQARRLRSALARYYRCEGIEDSIVIAVPLGTYVPVISRRVCDRTDGTTLSRSQDAVMTVESPMALHSDSESWFAVEPTTLKCSPCATFGPKFKEISEDRAAIDRLLDLFIIAVNAGDPEGWGAIMTDDFIFSVPDAPRYVGRDVAVAAAKRAFFDPFTLRLASRVEDVQIFRGKAFAHGIFVMEMMPKGGGNTITAPGKFTNFFRKQPDGSWRFQLVSFSYDQPTADRRETAGLIERSRSFLDAAHTYPLSVPRRTARIRSRTAHYPNFMVGGGQAS